MIKFRKLEFIFGFGDPKLEYEGRKVKIQPTTK